MMNPAVVPCPFKITPLFSKKQKDVYVSPLSYVPHFYHGKQSYDENRQLEQSSYRLCYIVKDEMVLLKSFYKKPLLKPLVSKITYIAFSNNKNSKKN